MFALYGKKKKSNLVFRESIFTSSALTFMMPTHTDVWTQNMQAATCIEMQEGPHSLFQKNPSWWPKRRLVAASIRMQHKHNSAKGKFNQNNELQLNCCKRKLPWLQRECHSACIRRHCNRCDATSLVTKLALTCLTQRKKNRKWFDAHSNTQCNCKAHDTH